MKKKIFAVTVFVLVMVGSITLAFAADNDNPFGPHYVTSPTTITVTK